MRDILRLAALFGLICCVASIGTADESKPLLPQELSLLRPTVERDLRKLMRMLDNTSPSDAELDGEFKRCKFLRLNLGSLGEAVVVEAQPGHGMANAAMLNVYARSGSGYRRIVEAMGFGPYVIPRQEAPPDLVFGWTSGVCTAKYYRYHYAKREYTVNGCAQEDRGGDPKPGEFCAITACSETEKLALFDPPLNKIPLDDLPKPDDSSCAPAPSIEPSQGVGDSAQPYNEVRFVLVPRTTGSCQPVSVESGIWTTSDPANTTISERGVATCIHPTSEPATINYTGSFHQHGFAPAYLICK